MSDQCSVTKLLIVAILITLANLYYQLECCRTNHLKTSMYRILNMTQSQHYMNNTNMKNKNVNDRTIVIAAIGDLLLHKELQIYALKNENWYKSIWTNLVPELKNADITYANYEGPSSNVYRDTNNNCFELNHTNKTFGYMYRSWDKGQTENVFNYSPRLALDVKLSGIDIVSVANNHMLDVCNIGLLKTIDTLQQNNITYVGARKNKRDKWFKITEIKDSTVAWIACTVSVNKGSRFKSDNLLRCGNKAFINTIQELRTASYYSYIDGIVVCIHAGKEFSYEPSEMIQKYAFLSVKAGASLVLCNHPHVSQPIETFYMHNRTNVIIWSLGNFVSRQGYSLTHQERRDIRRRSSGIVYFNMMTTQFGLEFQCFHYVPTCVKCNINEKEDGTIKNIEFMVANALDDSYCHYEREWMENVWGKNPTQCKYKPPNKLLKTMFQVETQAQGTIQNNIGNGYCTRDTQYRKFNGNQYIPYIYE